LVLVPHDDIEYPDTVAGNSGFAAACAGGLDHPFGLFHLLSIRWRATARPAATVTERSTPPFVLKVPAGQFCAVRILNYNFRILNSRFPPVAAT